MAQTTRPPDPQTACSLELVPYYRALYARWGPQNWWPARSPLEVIVGAYLTQNTNWGNVEKAIANLRRARALSVKALREMRGRRLAALIRSSGYFRQKAGKLKTFIRFLDRSYGGSLARMFTQPTAKLRDELLSLHGVGPETADSILLYAGNRPVFVVDAYTRRILERHGIVTARTGYEEIRLMVESALGGADPALLNPEGHGVEPLHPSSRMSRASRGDLVRHYNEMHALIVRVGKQHCRAKPVCDGCPLSPFLPEPPSV